MEWADFFELKHTSSIHGIAHMESIRLLTVHKNRWQIELN